VRRRRDTPCRSEAITRELTYRPPLDWRALLAFLGRRGIDGVEDVRDEIYRRTVRVDVRGAAFVGWIEVQPAKRRSALKVRLAGSLAPVIPATVARVKRLFDLSCDPVRVAAALGPLAAANPGLRVPGAFDGFEMAARAVIGQQITVKAARTVAGRFAAAFGDPTMTPFASVGVLFPSPARIAALRPSSIARVGVVSTRARAIIALARAIVTGDIVLEPGVDTEATLARLKRLPGIGDWTAHYIAMRALAWPDAFPHTDYGVMKALHDKSAASVLHRAAAWRPWRAYAVMHLWRSLEPEGS
jgi:AraC family transcriptional regulator of adaptative response / DNA-3-methyladenine glycosylase II